MLTLQAVEGKPVLFTEGKRAAANLEELLNVLPELAGVGSLAEVRWLGSVAVVLGSNLPNWPSRYTISKYVDYIGPSLSAELTGAFLGGLDDALNQVRKLDSLGLAAGDLVANLAAWVAARSPDDA